MYFYDTNVLLDGDKCFFEQEQKFYISIITLKELQNIKISTLKDQQIKFKARKAINWLIKNPEKYQVIILDSFKSKEPDEQIIQTALTVPDVTFVTYDLSCALIAKHSGLKVQCYEEQQIDSYTGFSKIVCPTDEALADFYSKINSNEPSEFTELNINEYLLVYDKNSQLIDRCV